jgi:uncharacterized protein YbjT (DUF2867 family)
MATPILVTGGTGTLGRRVVPLLRQAGRTVRVLSRRGHASGDGVAYAVGDLTTGEGVDAAVDGVDTIVHCAGNAKGDEDTTRVLVRAAARAGTPHLVHISVVGADRVPVVSAVDRAMFGYFASKRGAEKVVEECGLPWTILRATQFHDLTLTVVTQLAKLPVVPVPAGFRFQPVDTGEVAARLVDLALGRPAGLVPEIAGPRAYPMTELVRTYLAATHRRRLVVPVRLPGRAARAIRAGANLARNGGVVGRTWEEFLAGRGSYAPRISM